jgi:hypothetical protein
MPITLEFGAWAPDLANDPVQIPDTQGPMPIQCADCLNVYFSNGSYKNVASPSPALIGGIAAQTLNVPAINAFSYYDYVQQQQTVFAGTADGIQQLNPDGSWSITQFLTTQLAAITGQSMSFSIGDFANTFKLRGSRVTFSVASLQARIAGTSIVAGNAFRGRDLQLADTGFNHGTTANTKYGSCANPAILTGGTLLSIYDESSPNITVARLSATFAADPGKSAFGTVTAGRSTLATAVSTYSYDATSNTASWSWASNQFGFIAGSTYTVKFS